MNTKGPQRIICLTEEPTEILYLLGEEHRIVGITVYTVRPPEAKGRFPVVSAFVDGSVKRICELKPDLIIGFSDIQADLAAKLIRANQQVLIFNQRSIDEIFEVILTIGRIVSAEEKAEELVDGYRLLISEARKKTNSFKSRPRVYFEEWDLPTFSAIRWVSELIEIAGGIDIFSEKSYGKLAKEREIQWSDVIEKNPEIILASWCGKPVDIESIRKRPGWDSIDAVKDDRIYELDPSIILQPGPASLTDGLKVIQSLIHMNHCSNNKDDSD
jgi:iron complex transport system substrate-binding protein